jgi:hypothetical protein
MACAFGSEVLALQQDHIVESFFREVVGDAGTHDPATDNHYTRSRSQFVLSGRAVTGV